MTSKIKSLSEGCDFSQIGYLFIALTPLAFCHGWGDGWRDPKIFFLLTGLLLLFLHSLFSNDADAVAKAQTHRRETFATSVTFASFACLIVSQFIFLRLQLSLVLPIFFGFLIMALLTGPVRVPKLGRWGIPFGLIVAGVEGALVLSQFTGFDPIREKPVLDFIKWRSTGTMGNPNVVGAYLGLSCILFFTQQKLTKLKLGFFLVFILLPLLLTFSRSTFLALALAALADRSSKSRFNSLRALLALLVLGLVGFFAAYSTPAGHSFLTQTGLLNTASLIGRLNENQHAFNYLNSSNILFGIGWNHYRLQPGAASDFIHNEWLGALIEGGVIGFSLMLMLAYLLVRFFASRSRHARAIAIFILVLSMVDFPLRSPAFLSVFIFLFFAHLTDANSLID